MNRLAAWWSAWKWVAILLAVCIALAALNVWQWKRAITAPLRAENKDLTDALATVASLARDRNRDDAALWAELQAMVERGRTTRTVYLQAAAAAPLPQQCAPGQARADAVNDILGPVGPVTGERK